MKPISDEPRMALGWTTFAALAHWQCVVVLTPATYAT